MVRAARCLLAAITRVLLLADSVVVKQLLLAKDKVSHVYPKVHITLLRLPFSSFLLLPCVFGLTNQYSKSHALPLKQITFHISYPSRHTLCNVLSHTQRTHPVYIFTIAIFPVPDTS